MDDLFWVGTMRIRWSRVITGLLLAPVFLWGIYQQFIVSHSQALELDYKVAVLDSSGNLLVRVDNPRETVGGPVVIWDQPHQETASTSPEEKKLLEAEVKVLESKKDELTGQIAGLRDELEQLQQLKADQVKVLNTVLEQNAKKQQFFAWVIGILTTLLVELLFLNKRVRAFFIEV